MMMPFQPQSISYRILSSDNLERQCAPNAEKHKERPLPPKRVNHYAEHEPVYQLGVSEEVESSGWRTTLDKFSQVDPFLHPAFSWPCERVHQEHEEQARIDSNVILEISGVSFPSQTSNLEFQ